MAITADVSIGPIRIEILLSSKLLTVSENTIQIDYNLVNLREDPAHKRPGNDIRDILKIVYKLIKAVFTPTARALVPEHRQKIASYLDTENQTLYSGTGTVHEFWRGYLKKKMCSH